MDRRKALKIMTGTVAGGGAVGVIALTTAFKPKVPPAAKPQKLAYEQGESAWAYSQLDPVATVELAYQSYDKGSCMYATFKSIISQLANQVGEPFASFPCEMMKYGHGGIGGYGTVCGALNGAAALIGLLVPDKKNQDCLIESLFHWYEQSQLPKFSPANPLLDFTPPTSISNSVLCHASTTNWSKASGHKLKSKEQKERCRRLTADVAFQTVTILNQFFNNNFMTSVNASETIRTCITCHSQEGKLANTSGKMNCSSCHSESLGHKLFADIHYKLLKEKL
jgi:hypothetical protein